MGQLCFDVVLSWKVLEREAAAALRSIYQMNRRWARVGQCWSLRCGKAAIMLCSSRKQ